MMERFKHARAQRRTHFYTSTGANRERCTVVLKFMCNSFMVNMCISILLYPSPHIALFFLRQHAVFFHTKGLHLTLIVEMYQQFTSFYIWCGFIRT
jgi:hypothetical protein